MSHTLTEPALRALVTEFAKRDVSNVSLDEDLMQALDIDSLTALRVLAAVEKRFGVRIPDAELATLRTMGQLLHLTEREPKESSS